MRIALGGIVWESLTFSPVKAYKDDYAYYRGQNLLDAFDINPLASELDFEPIPLIYASCKAPGGWSSKEGYDYTLSEILESIKSAGPLDGIALLLHGANQVDGGVGCAEEGFVLAVRDLVGPDMLIAGRYDQHANITTPQAESLNIITIYRTAPHRDTVTRYHDTLRLLVNAIRTGSRPKSTYIRIPMLIMGEKSTNVTEPMRSLIPLAVEASIKPGILNADISVGYAWGDVPISGMGVAVTAESEESFCEAIRIRDELARAVWQRRYDFEICGEYAPDIDSGIQRALEAPESTVFMSDVGDNITAGAPGDTTVFLAKLLESNVPDAVVAGITDKENTQLCFEKGLGATVTLTVGGKLDLDNSKPLKVTGTIINLYTPPAGSLKDVRTATLKVEGVTLVLTEERWAYVHMKQFMDAGIDPLEHKMVVVKLGYLHPELIDIAPRGYMVLSPGYTTLNLNELPFHKVIRPIFPLDEFEWDPETA